MNKRERFIYFGTVYIQAAATTWQQRDRLIEQMLKVPKEDIEKVEEDEVPDAAYAYVKYVLFAADKNNRWSGYSAIRR